MIAGFVVKQPRAVRTTGYAVKNVPIRSLSLPQNRTAKLDAAASVDERISILIDPQLEYQKQHHAPWIVHILENHGRETTSRSISGRATSNKVRRGLDLYKSRDKVGDFSYL
jgi:hypothetical protein